MTDTEDSLRVLLNAMLSGREDVFVKWQNDGGYMHLMMFLSIVMAVVTMARVVRQ